MNSAIQLTLTWKHISQRYTQDHREEAALASSHLPQEDTATDLMCRRTTAKGQLPVEEPNSLKAIETFQPSVRAVLKSFKLGIQITEFSAFRYVSLLSVHQVLQGNLKEKQVKYNPLAIQNVKLVIVTIVSLTRILICNLGLGALERAA